MSTEQHDKDVQAYISENFTKRVIDPLTEFVKIPNVSRVFDSEWETNGLMDKACNFVIEHAQAQELENFSIELLKEQGKPNIVLAIADMKDAPTILLYGHIDKQPPLTHLWNEGLHPYQPVIKDGKLYGRGTADDGYAFFTSLFIVKALQACGLQKHRFVLFFECDEESGSRDMVYYLNKHSDKIGEPSVMLCLDSGTIDYDHLTLTTSLRGSLKFKFKVEITKEGIHSGTAGGIVPDTYRIARHILNQFEDSRTGQLIPELYVSVPKDKYEQACSLIDELGRIDFMIPFLEGVQPVVEDPLQQVLAKTWFPSCTIIGFDGLPGTKSCGNVLNPSTTYVLSCRLPPSLQFNDGKAIVAKFFADLKVPYGAKITLDFIQGGTGINIQTYPAQLSQLISEAGHKFYGKKPLYNGEGGSIPFIGSLQSKFPKTDIIVSGVLGPESNAHGPNEFLHIKFCENLIRSFVHIFANYGCSH